MKLRTWVADHSQWVIPALLLAAFAAAVIPAFVHGRHTYDACEAAGGTLVRGTCVDDRAVIDLHD